MPSIASQDQMQNSQVLPVQETISIDPVPSWSFDAGTLSWKHGPRSTPITGDEAYFVQWATHLDYGYPQMNTRAKSAMAPRVTQSPKKAEDCSRALTGLQL